MMSPNSQPGDRYLPGIRLWQHWLLGQPDQQLEAASAMVDPERAAQDMVSALENLRCCIMGISGPLGIRYTGNPRSFRERGTALNHKLTTYESDVLRVLEWRIYSDFEDSYTGGTVHLQFQTRPVPTRNVPSPAWDASRSVHLIDGEVVMPITDIKDGEVYMHPVPGVDSVSIRLLLTDLHSTTDANERNAA